MNPRTLIILGAVLVGVSSSAPAQGHFRLEQPADALVTGPLGDPQKVGPCGPASGTPSNVVTKVKAGSTLHLKVTETVKHDGHFRVALAADRAAFVDPVMSGPSCTGPSVVDPPSSPILADGLFPHMAAEVAPGTVWETDITIPSTPCPSCTLQVMQVMTNHPPGCFYYHCANLEIVAGEDGGDGDGGAATTLDLDDAGATPEGVPLRHDIVRAEAAIDDGRGAATSAADSCGVGWGRSSGAALLLVGLATAAASWRRRSAPARTRR